jgi:hypothetical protein
LKRLTITSLFFVAMAMVAVAQSITARIEGDQLRIAAPKMHFLVGEVLDRLHDGATVKFEFQLALRSDRNGDVLARNVEQFAISYDLWEEKFAVTKLGSPTRSVSHLPAAAAEAWCIDNTSIPVAAINASRQFWMRLDYRVIDTTATPDKADNSGFTLTGLIDILSRRPRGEQLHGSEEAGPFRVESLKRK